MNSSLIEMPTFSPMRRFIAVAVCGLILALPAYAGARPDINQSIMKAVAALKTASSDSDKASDIAEHICDLTEHANPEIVDDATIRELITLLDSRDISVRAWIAASLGNLHQRGRMAVPKFLQMLPKEDCLDGVLTPAVAIRFALHKMGIKEPPIGPCNHHPIAD